MGNLAARMGSGDGSAEAEANAGAAAEAHSKKNAKHSEPEETTGGSQGLAGSDAEHGQQSESTGQANDASTSHVGNAPGNEVGALLPHLRNRQPDSVFMAWLSNSLAKTGS